MFRLHGVARLVPLFVAALGACIDSNGPQVDVDLSQSEFTRPGEAAAVVRFTVHNNGDTYAYFRGCESPIPVVLERENNGIWEVAGNYNTSCTGAASQLSLEPGASHPDSITVAVASQYRLNIWFGSNINAPYASAVRSETFQVH